jgi:hypothetical protein
MNKLNRMLILMVLWAFLLAGAIPVSAAHRYMALDT